jgi:hypothetical protein
MSGKPVFPKIRRAPAPALGGRVANYWGLQRSSRVAGKCARGTGRGCCCGPRLRGALADQRGATDVVRDGTSRDARDDRTPGPVARDAGECRSSDGARPLRPAGLHELANRTFALEGVLDEPFLALCILWFSIDLRDDSSSFWFYWPMQGTGIGVVIMGVVLLGIGGILGSDWERREVDKYLRRKGNEQHGQPREQGAANAIPSGGTES